MNKGGRQRGQRVGRYGAGSVVRKGPDTFRIQVRLENGKRVQRQVRCKTEAEAWSILHDLRRSDGGSDLLEMAVLKQYGVDLTTLPEELTGPVPVDHTFDEAANAWVEHLKAQGRSTSYLKEVQRTLRRDILPALGKKSLRGVTVEDLETLYATLVNAGQSASTVHKTAQYVGGIFALAERRDWIERNVAKRAQAPKQRSAFTVQEKGGVHPLV